MRRFFTGQLKKGGLAVICVFVALVAIPKPAAACHSACLGVQPPDCLGCKFVAFQLITCVRGACDYCEEDYCTVQAFSPTEKLACGEQGEKGSTVKALKVETLSPRS